MLTLMQQSQSNRQNLKYENEHPFQSTIEHRVKLYGKEEFSIKNLILEAQLRSDIGSITQKDVNDVATMLKGLGYVKGKQGSGKSRARTWKLAQ